MSTPTARLVAWAIVAWGILALPALAREQDPDPATAPRISVAELKQLRADNRVLVIDVRDLDSYKAGHIPGAICIPEAETAGHVAELKAEKRPIVTYCA